MLHSFRLSDLIEPPARRGTVRFNRRINSWIGTETESRTMTVGVPSTNYKICRSMYSAEEVGRDYVIAATVHLTIDNTVLYINQSINQSILLF